MNPSDPPPPFGIGQFLSTPPATTPPLMFPPLPVSSSYRSGYAGTDQPLPSHPVLTSALLWDPTSNTEPMFEDPMTMPHPSIPLMAMNSAELLAYLRLCGVEDSTLKILEAQHFDGRSFLLAESHLQRLDIPLGPMLLLQQIIKNDRALQDGKQPARKANGAQSLGAQSFVLPAGPFKPVIPQEILTFWATKQAADGYESVVLYLSELKLPEKDLICPFDGCSFVSKSKTDLALHLSDFHIQKKEKEKEKGDGDTPPAATIFPDYGTMGSELEISLPAALSAKLQPSHSVWFVCEPLQLRFSVAATLAGPHSLLLTFQSDFPGMSKVIFKVIVQDAPEIDLVFTWQNPVIFSSKRILYGIPVPLNPNPQQLIEMAPRIALLPEDKKTNLCYSYAVLGIATPLEALAKEHLIQVTAPQVSTGQTIFHVGLSFNQVDIVAVGLKHGISLDVMDKTGQTPRMILNRLSEDNSCKKLVRAHCTARIRDAFEVTREGSEVSATPQVFQGFDEITQLKLESCGLTHLSSSFNSFSNISELNLSHNLLGEQAIQTLANFMTTSRTIRVVKLVGVKLSQSSLNLLLEALHERRQRPLPKVEALEVNDFHVSDFSHAPAAICAKGSKATIEHLLQYQPNLPPEELSSLAKVSRAEKQKDQKGSALTQPAFNLLLFASEQARADIRIPAHMIFEQLAMTEPANSTSSSVTPSPAGKKGSRKSARPLHSLPQRQQPPSQEDYSSLITLEVAERQESGVVSISNLLADDLVDNLPQKRGDLEEGVEGDEEGAPPKRRKTGSPAKSSPKIKDPKYQDRKATMMAYIEENDVQLSPTMKAVPLATVFDEATPRTIFKNSQHIICLEDSATGYTCVLAYYPRCKWLKRLNGKLRKLLAGKNFKQEKMITRKPGLECFYDYVPTWVTDKNQRETFAAQLLLFVNTGELLPAGTKKSPASAGSKAGKKGRKRRGNDDDDKDDDEQDDEDDDDEDSYGDMEDDGPGLDHPHLATSSSASTEQKMAPGGSNLTGVARKRGILQGKRTSEQESGGMFAAETSFALDVPSFSTLDQPDAPGMF